MRPTKEKCVGRKNTYAIVNLIGYETELRLIPTRGEIHGISPRCPSVGLSLVDTSHTSETPPQRAVCKSPRNAGDHSDYSGEKRETDTPDPKIGVGKEALSRIRILKLAQHGVKWKKTKGRRLGGT